MTKLWQWLLLYLIAFYVILFLFFSLVKRPCEASLICLLPFMCATV